MILTLRSTHNATYEHTSVHASHIPNTLKDMIHIIILSNPNYNHPFTLYSSFPPFLSMSHCTGITGRDEYEKISRDIRYGFYTQVLSATGCAGVIFGHHQGDVQENVISNVMRSGAFFAAFYDFDS
jgi:hypothetical protein